MKYLELRNRNTQNREQKTNRSIPILLKFNSHHKAAYIKNMFPLMCLNLLFTGAGVPRGTSRRSRESWHVATSSGSLITRSGPTMASLVFKRLYFKVLFPHGRLNKSLQEFLRVGWISTHPNSYSATASNT